MLFKNYELQGQLFSTAMWAVKIYTFIMGGHYLFLSPANARLMVYNSGRHIIDRIPQRGTDILKGRIFQ